MVTSTVTTPNVVMGADPDNARTYASAVSWGAIVAGATAAAALSLILLILGIGLGLSSISPWVQNGIGATAFGVSTILWLTFTQLAASGMGGYLAGRLRTKWVTVHRDEVYFRDTAHGFLAWAVASLATAALLTSVIGVIVSGGASVAGAVATTATGAAVGAGTAAGSGIAKPANDAGPMGYFIDSLFRSDKNTAPVSTGNPGSGGPVEGTTKQALGDILPEVTRIFMNSIRTASLPPEDVQYAGQVVASRTGLSQQDAEKRVRDTFARVQGTLRDAEISARDAADKARKASAYAALWLFTSLLIGAFIASLAATYGGRRRDL